jgi:hypothetical protein
MSLQASSASARIRGLRPFIPWLVVLLLAGLVVGLLPSARAQSGANASSAIPINPDGSFVGSVATGTPIWFVFSYGGGNNQATITINYVPPDANQMDLQLYTGDPNNPRQENESSTANNNTRTIVFSDPNSRSVYIKVSNNNQGRSVSFTGTVSPTSTLATPTPTATATGTPTSTNPNATPGPGDNASVAVTVGGDGVFSGTISPHQAVWYRAWYGNPGAKTEITAAISPSTDNADLNLYTGTDVNNLQQQGGGANKSSTTLSRDVNLSNQQYVYFTIANNNDSTNIAYSGTVTPAFAPPGGTPTATGTPGTATPTSAPATATPAPSSTPAAAPALNHDGQYYAQTGFRVDDAANSYFNSNGGVKTFGFPVSRAFTFLGCPSQIYQRLIIQFCPGQPVTVVNMLDPEIFPYTRINGSVYPAPDSTIKNDTPVPGTPAYAGIEDFVKKIVPDTWNGLPVNFYQTYLQLGGLSILGTPISNPAPDPTNNKFVYQRFQRVVLHFQQDKGTTEPLLLADYQKSIMTTKNLPDDLKQQAQGSKFYNQYCPGATRWLCRPGDLPTSDLTYAFEQG